MEMKNIRIAAFTTCVAVLLGCGASEHHVSPAAAGSPLPVNAITVAERQMPDVYAAPGTVRAKTSSILSSKITAYVESVEVAEGDRVNPGQTLVRLSAQDLDAGYRSAKSAQDEALRTIEEAESGIAEAKSNLDLTETTYKRLEDLFQKRSISNQEFDEGAAKLKSARAAYDRARARGQQAQSRAQQMEAEVRSAEVARGYATVVAPFQGIVVRKNVEPGVLAAPGMPLLTLERNGNYRLEVSAEEARRPSIRVGDRVPVQIDALGRNLSAVVSEVAPVADAASRTYTVKLDLPPDRALHSGLFGRASFPIAKRTVLSLPCDAIYRRGEIQSVLIVEAGFARRRLITTGSQIGSDALVLSGLNSGDQVIFPIPNELRDGMPVEVQR